jgi:restriction endonuclease S subunit
MTMIKLKDIAHCSNGYTFRERPHSEQHAKMQIIQIGDVSLKGSLAFDTLIQSSYQPAYKKFLLQPNDIIFRGRGGCVAIVVEQSDQPQMVASPLIIIRLKKNTVLPQYLAWFMNSSQAARYFARCGQGTLLKAVGLKELQQLQIPIPSLAKQQNIVDVSSYFNKEQILLNKIQHCREKLINQTLLQTAYQHHQQDMSYEQ